MFRRIDQSDDEKNASQYPSWLNDLATTLDVKSTFQASDNKKWSSIDEKLADIKDRVGFSLLGIHREDTDQLKTAEINKSANEKKQHKQEDVEKMSQVLSFINDVIRNEPHLDAAIVINKCKEQAGLSFDQLPIDITKLRNYIDSKLPKEINKIEYQPQQAIPEKVNLEDNLADYYRHALDNK